MTKILSARELIREVSWKSIRGKKICNIVDHFLLNPPLSHFETELILVLQLIDYRWRDHPLLLRLPEFEERAPSIEEDLSLELISELQTQGTSIANIFAQYDAVLTRWRGSINLKAKTARIGDVFLMHLMDGTCAFGHVAAELPNLGRLTYIYGPFEGITLEPDFCSKRIGPIKLGVNYHIRNQTYPVIARNVKIAYPKPQFIGFNGDLPTKYYSDLWISDERGERNVGKKIKPWMLELETDVIWSAVAIENRLTTGYDPYSLENYL